MKIGDIVRFKDESKNPATGALMVASTPWKNGDKRLVKLALLDVRQDSCTSALIVTKFEKLRGAVVESEVENTIENVNDVYVEHLRSMISELKNFCDEQDACKECPIFFKGCKGRFISF